MFALCEIVAAVAEAAGGVCMAAGVWCCSGGGEYGSEHMVVSTWHSWRMAVSSRPVSQKGQQDTHISLCMGSKEVTQGAWWHLQEQCRVPAPHT